MDAVFILNINPECRLVKSTEKRLFNFVIPRKIRETKRKGGTIRRYRIRRVAESGEKIICSGKAVTNEHYCIANYRSALDSWRRLWTIRNLEKHFDIRVRRTQHVGNRKFIFSLGKICWHRYFHRCAVSGGSVKCVIAIKIDRKSTRLNSSHMSI